MHSKDTSALLARQGLQMRRMAYQRCSWLRWLPVQAKAWPWTVSCSKHGAKGHNTHCSSPSPGMLAYSVPWPVPCCQALQVHDTFLQMRAMTTSRMTPSHCNLFHLQIPQSPCSPFRLLASRELSVWLTSEPCKRPLSVAQVMSQCSRRYNSCSTSYGDDAACA